MKHKLLLLSILLCSFLLFSFNSPTKAVRETKATTEVKKLGRYLYFEFDSGGCHYIVELNINDAGNGGSGFLSRDCGKGSQTIRFNIKKLVYVARTDGYQVESKDDIEWIDPLPSDINNDSFLNEFLSQLNANLE